MKPASNLTRKTHFLGTKIRNLRKRNRLTMEDLSARCIKINPQAAPSVSYLSMIERGKRVPSQEMLAVIGGVFQKDVSWFLDDATEEDITPIKTSRGGINGMALEPSFLFSKDILQIAIPEMLSQTGVSGRQFAHLLIRAYQEHHQNHFPDLERAAEEVGLKRLPLSTEDMLDIVNQMGLTIKWFERAPEEVLEENGERSLGAVRSFFHPPGTLYLNQILQHQPERLKYDLALHIGHCVLHNRDGMKSMLLAGKSRTSMPDQVTSELQDSTVDAQDILHAWRDFECSFFAGALLCPKVPFRQMLDRYGYEVSVDKMVGVSPSVVMRRMTAVSPYPHWHYFDAYPPGTLKAVYRGNGIPLPWGNMRMMEDPCPQWAVFRMINAKQTGTSAQISIMDVGNAPRIYSCESIKVSDMAGNDHVLCAGVDLNPALDAQGISSLELADEIRASCIAEGGAAPIPTNVRKQLASVAKILNINWVERGIYNEAQLICSRGGVCPRTPCCSKATPNPSSLSRLEKIQQDIIANQ